MDKGQGRSQKRHMISGVADLYIPDPTRKTQDAPTKPITRQDPTRLVWMDQLVGSFMDRSDGLAAEIR